MIKEKTQTLVTDQLYNLAAGFLYALSICYFAKGADFAPGGLSGLALLGNYLWGFPIGIATLVLNVPLILLGFRFVGRAFLGKTVISMLWCTFFQDVVFADQPGYGGDPLLAALFAGITWGGSGSSHTAILARTLGIPAIVGMGDALKPELEGRAAIADGSTGALVIDPDDDTRDRLLKKRDEQLRLQRLLETLKGQANVTKDGKTIRIYCNIGSPEDVHAVQVNDGGGIGLFRSEFLYLNTTDYPTEDQQFEAYKQVLSDMDGKEVIIRTLDIGADKQIGYFDLPKEDNPAMGMRALRICLTRPEIFKTQLRALFRASAFGKLGIMFPMVTSVWEVREAKRMCEEVRRELKNEGIPYSEDVQIGIMIETPAAAINSDRLAKEVDFFSIGTNDLTQYTLACDRQNNDLGRFYDPHHPAVLRLIRLVTENAHKNGIWVGICGELGADLTLTETFLAIGVDELSVTPRSVLPLRNAVRMTDTRESSERILSDLDSDYTAR